MDAEIALLLTIDGIANGAIYVLIALGTVLIFSVTRVMFVPFGDIAAVSALTLAMLQGGQLPGTVWLVALLAVLATVLELGQLARAGKFAQAPRAIAGYALLPAIPIAAAVLLNGVKLPIFAQMLLTLALVTPIAPLIDRIVFRPLADASALVLLMVAVAVHFALSGLSLMFFGPEGFRTEPISREIFTFGPVTLSAQMLFMLGAAILFSWLLYVFFERTIAGKSLRATAINRVGARIVGIRPARTSTIAYVLASLLGGISGLLIGPVATLYYDSGFLIGLKAFVGAVVGGLASYPMAAVGAILIGILESFASFWSSTLKESIVFAALIPILVWRSFLHGSHESEEEDEDIE